MMTLTGSTIEPLIFVMSPKCFNGEPPYKLMVMVPALVMFVLLAPY